MKNKLLCLVCATLALCFAADAAPLARSKSLPQGWGEDFPAAQRQAASEGKLILLAFSGSDWCHWCVKMERDVFSQPAFVHEASKKYVLVMADCPSDETILSDLARRQNRALAQRFRVRGFPSLLVLDAEGRELKRQSGYLAGGPQGALTSLAALTKDVTWPTPKAAAK